MFRSTSPHRVADAQAAVSELLRDRHGLTSDQKSDFGISNLAEIYAAHEAVLAQPQCYVITVTSITLFGGCVGIASIKLASVMQRRSEIGLRVAIGARQCGIALQFIAESIMIAVPGSIPRVAIGVFSALPLSTIFHWPLMFSLSSIELTVLASAAIGLAAGLIPALRAAKLDPIEPLQA